jgi:hypothetical protein
MCTINLRLISCQHPSILTIRSQVNMKNNRKETSDKSLDVHPEEPRESLQQTTSSSNDPSSEPAEGNIIDKPAKVSRSKRLDKLERSIENHNIRFHEFVTKFDTMLVNEREIHIEQIKIIESELLETRELLKASGIVRKGKAYAETNESPQYRCWSCSIRLMLMSQDLGCGHKIYCELCAGHLREEIEHRSELSYTIKGGEYMQQYGRRIEKNPELGMQCTKEERDKFCARCRLDHLKERLK